MKEVYLESKPRYEILDALRGVAAFIVVIYHHFETFGSGITSFHGYLAVDFFFILSGFVIGYAYDDRWDRMTTWQFCKRRLTRLHPMLVWGTILGLLFFYFGMSDELANIRDAHWPEILLCTLLALVMIPVPQSLDVRGWADFNPMNGNTWTLTYEYIANLLYALVIRRFNKVVLGIFVALAAILTIGVGLNWNMFGLMANRPAEHFYTFIGGWNLNSEELLLGFSRLLFPFFAGLLMARLFNGSQPSKGRHNFLISAVLLAGILAIPSFGNNLLNGITEMLSILIMFPIIVYIGAKGTVSGKCRKWCKWLGDISFPLYLTHTPIIFTLCLGWKSNNPDATQDQILVVCICSIILSILTAWASFKLWDEPVRQWLKVHWLHGKTSR